MERKIKFRYRYTDGTNWIMQVFTLEEIVNGDPFEVLSDSPLLKRYKHVGQDQWLGLLDQHKTEIFEGDIMKIRLDEDKAFWGGKNLNRTGVVRYESDYGAFIVEWEWSKNQHHEILNCDLAFTGEVIGNIYQHPNLPK